MNTFGERPQILFIFWFSMAWILAISTLIWSLENLNAIFRWAIFCGAVLQLIKLFTSVDRRYILSPFFVIGFITLAFYSVIPSLYGQVFPEPIAYFLTKAPRTSHDHAITYIGSQAEILILQFSAFCFFAFSLCVKWKSSARTVETHGENVSGDPNYLLAVLHFIVYATAILFLVSRWTIFGQAFFSSGLGAEFRHALAPVMSFSSAALAYYSARNTSSLKCFGLVTLFFALGAMIVSGLAATAVFIFLVAISVFLITIKISFGKLPWVFGGAALIIPLSILVTIVPRGEAQTTHTDHALIELFAVKLTSKLVHRQTTSAHCLDGIYKKHRSAESTDPFFFITAIVPRALWPEKPILSRGSEYAEKYCNQVGAAKLQHSESITLLGEPLLNGGILGVFIAQLCITIFFFIATRSLGSGQSVQIIFVAALLPWLATFEQHFAEYFGNLVKVIIIMIPFFTALTYLLWRHRKTPA